MAKRVEGGREVPSPSPKTGKPISRARIQDLPLLSELPSEIRERVGSLEINVHSYSANPAERLVFINMHRYREGERIGENGPLLREITPEGVIIDYGGGEARVKVWP